METTELRVNGMTCSSCVASVTKALARVTGVRWVQVDLRSGTVRVTGDHTKPQVPAMLAALSDAGYEASRAGAAEQPATVQSPRSCGTDAPERRGGCCCH